MIIYYLLASTCSYIYDFLAMRDESYRDKKSCSLLDLVIIGSWEELARARLIKSYNGLELGVLE